MLNEDEILEKEYEESVEFDSIFDAQLMKIEKKFQEDEYKKEQRKMDDKELDIIMDRKLVAIDWAYFGGVDQSRYVGLDQFGYPLGQILDEDGAIKAKSAEGQNARRKR